MQHKRRAAAAIILLALLLTGCWDRSEIEDQAYVILLGLDRGDEGKIMVSTDLAITQSLSAGLLGARASAGPPHMAVRLLTVQAETITQAITTLNGGMSRRLDLRQLRGIVVGEELAREGLEPLLMELSRHSLARPSALLVQARGRAYDLLRLQEPVGEVNPGRMADGLILQAKQLHLAPPVRMHHFMLRLAAPGGDPYLPAAAVNPWITIPPQEPKEATATSAIAGDMPRGGGNPVEFIGTAIFRRDRLAGFLSVDETQMLLALRGEMGKAYTTFPDPTDPDKPVTLRFHQENKPTYKASFRGARPYVKVRIVFEGEVLAIPGGTDFVPPEMRQRLERASKKYAEETMARLLTRLHDWEADAVGFGHQFRGSVTTWPEWDRYDWPKHVKDLEVEVSVEMRIRRYGLITGPDRVPEGH